MSKSLAIAIAVAACGGKPAVVTGPAAIDDTLDVGVAFVPESNPPTQLDLDGDGQVELIENTVQVDGKDGVATSIRVGDKALLVVGSTTSAIADARRDDKGVTLRLQPSYGDAGDARFSRTLRFRFATKDWEAGPSSLMARQTTLPGTPAKPPYPHVELSEVGELRTSPIIDDEGVVAGNATTTATLHGNVVVELSIGTAGIALGTRGDWTYVAMTSDTPPRATSLRSQGALGTLDRHATALQRALAAPPSMCGWVESAKLRPL